MDSTADLTIACLDLTLLEPGDDPHPIERLCRRAVTPRGPVAAVCIHSRFVPAARAALDAAGGAAIAVATVANFPDGEADSVAAAGEIRRAVNAGADEIDVVLPWRRLQAGDTEHVESFVARCRRAAGDHVLKVILETGELKTPELIHQAAMCAILNGADFLKTSTGKVAVNATPAAVRTMLEAIDATDADCGIKASGGIRTLADATIYVELAREVMGDAWVHPDRFRIGASSLLDDILQER